MGILMGVILMVILLVAVISISSILNGWALKTLWGWFIVPVFGLPALSLPEAIGVAIVAGYLTYQIQTNPKEKEGGEAFLTNLFVQIFIRPLLAVGIGYIVHLFM